VARAEAEGSDGDRMVLARMRVMMEAGVREGTAAE
jgi:hypothetical protein